MAINLFEENSTEILDKVAEAIDAGRVDEGGRLLLGSKDFTEAGV
jgi:hypothetical protein